MLRSRVLKHLNPQLSNDCLMAHVCLYLLSASCGVATLRARLHSKASSEACGPVPLWTSMLRMRANSQIQCFCSKVPVSPYLCKKHIPYFRIYLKRFQSFSTGRNVWAFTGNQPVRGYPKTLTAFGLPRGVRKIDAALHDVNSGKTLFFVGNNYFR